MTKTYSIRLDGDTKSNEVFNDLGMDFSTGIKIYLKQVIKTNWISFNLNNEDHDSLDQAIAEYKAGKSKSFNFVDELFKDLDRDEDD